jgi:hypothetical protein
LQLKSDCEKEIEEVVAQIRRKYETKIQEMEAEFDIKKKELDVNHTKVLMNKILADAFRSKCMAPGSSGKQGMSHLIPFDRLVFNPLVGCSNLDVKMSNVVYLSSIVDAECIPWSLDFIFCIN